MSIRADALRWLESSHGRVDGHIYTSKFYQPHESWTKRRTWWLEFPVGRLRHNKFIHFVCQTAPNKNNFHHFKVPCRYILENLEDLYVMNNMKLSIFLSAENENMFVDERGDGKVSFSKYLIKSV